MREDYKGHAIHSTASFLPDGWKPHVYIAFSDGDQNILKDFTIIARLRRQKRQNKRGFLLRKRG